MEYKVTGSVKSDNPVAQSEQRKLQRQALRFVLYEGKETQLLLRARSGRMSCCLLPQEIGAALASLQDAHGHFAEDLVIKKVIGQFFWPTRRLDIYKYCRSFFAQTSEKIRSGKGARRGGGGGGVPDTVHRMVPRARR